MGRGRAGDAPYQQQQQLCPISSFIKIFQWKQRSAARSQQLSVPLRAMQRGSIPQRTLASSPATPGSGQRPARSPTISASISHVIYAGMPARSALVRLL